MPLQINAGLIYQYRSILYFEMTLCYIFLWYIHSRNQCLRNTAAFMLRLYQCHYKSRCNNDRGDAVTVVLFRSDQMVCMIDTIAVYVQIKAMDQIKSA